jgi:hypothetical protein
MRYKIEIYPESGQHSTFLSDDPMLDLEAEYPFPQPDLGERIGVLAQSNDDADYWVVLHKQLIYRRDGCTLQLWCRKSTKPVGDQERE